MAERGIETGHGVTAMRQSAARMSARVTIMRATLRGPRAGENQNLPPFVTYYVTWAIAACRDAATPPTRRDERRRATAPTLPLRLPRSLPRHPGRGLSRNA